MKEILFFRGRFKEAEDSRGYFFPRRWKNRGGRNEKGTTSSTIPLSYGNRLFGIGLNRLDLFEWEERQSCFPAMHLALPPLTPFLSIPFVFSPVSSVSVISTGLANSRPNSIRFEPKLTIDRGWFTEFRLENNERQILRKFIESLGLKIERI